MAANQAQLLRILNEVNNLENQIKTAQSQVVAPVASNPMLDVNTNLLSMLSQIPSNLNAANNLQNQINTAQSQIIAPVAPNPTWGVNTNLPSMLSQLQSKLNEVNNLQNQIKMAQSQMVAPVATNPMQDFKTNLLSMLSQIQFKGSNQMQFGKPGAKLTEKGNTGSISNTNITSLLAALSGDGPGLPMGTNTAQAPNPTVINAAPVASNPMLEANTNLLSMLSQMQSKLSLLAGLTGDAIGQEERGRCISVAGLPESYQDANKLINIFRNFGNVRKVVFTDKRPDRALIELDDARGSIKAVTNMHNRKLDGQPIKVSFTKIDHLGLNSNGKSKDIRQAKETWRFRNNKEAKFRKICLSSLKVLGHSVAVSRVPEGKSDQLKEFIVESGYTVKSMEERKRSTDESKPKSEYITVFVELASVEEAIDAVANLHNSWPEKFGINSKSRGLAFSLRGAEQTKQS